MRRREFIAGAAATAAMAFAHPVSAQTNARPTGLKRIAIAHPTEPPEGLTVHGRRAYRAYFGELERLGYIEGQNLIVERYSALGQPDRYAQIARDIVASQPDAILPFGSMALQLKALTTSIPILLATTDPVAGGLVTNLANPGGNITGVSIDAGLELWGKRFQLLWETVRKLSKVYFLRAGAWPTVGGERVVEVLREAARRADIPFALILMNEKKVDREAYEQNFDLMGKNGADGLVVAESAEHLTYRQLIVDLASQIRLPAIYPLREFTEVGGLMSYGIDSADVMRRMADITDEIFRGTKPGDIPFYQQTKYELLLNRKTAQSLGLEVPRSLLATADEVIE